jgi:hypothetical protein
MADSYELNVTWSAAHPRLDRHPDGELPLVPFARRPRRFGRRIEALDAADSAVRSVQFEHVDAHGIEATVHLLRFTLADGTARIAWRQHVATVTEDERIEHDRLDAPRGDAA